MTQKFRDIVNAPHRAFGRARQKIQDVQTNSKKGAFVRGAGVVTTGIFEFMLWLTTYVTLDNHLLRKMETALANKKVAKNADGQDKKISAFMKKYPNLSAHMMYYMMLSAVALGMVATDKIIDNDGNSKIIKRHRASDDLMSRKLNPQSPDFIHQCIELENILAIPVIYTETYRATPKVQPKETVWTHGYGMTWSPDANGNMTIRDYVRGRNAHKPAMVRSKDSDCDELQKYLENDVYPKIARYMKREISVSELMGICVAGYQYPGHVQYICNKLNNAITSQQIADSFITSDKKGWGGVVKRRWVCGLLAAGYINLEDILNADIDAFYLADANTFMRGNSFITNTSTIEYVMGLRRGVSTREEINTLSDGRVALAQLDGVQYDVPRVIDIENENTNESKSMNTMLKAQRMYDKKKYERAAELFAQAIEQDSDNMEAYSSLAITYIHLADETHLIEDYEKATVTVVECNARMNANRTLLHDPDVKAATYFNAGVAREKMADIYSSQGNSVAAKENYKKALQNYKTALTNCKNGNNDAVRLNSYNRSIEKMENKINGMRAEFVRGKDKIENALDARGRGIAPIFVDEKSNA